MRNGINSISSSRSIFWSKDASNLLNVVNAYKGDRHTLYEQVLKQLTGKSIESEIAMGEVFSMDISFQSLN